MPHFLVFAVSHLQEDESRLNARVVALTGSTNLGQPLLALGVSRLGDGPLGLLDEVARLVHDVGGAVQHGVAGLGVGGVGGHPARGRGQGAEGLGHVPSRHAWAGGS